jgi:hypothetical protein
MSTLSNNIRKIEGLLDREDGSDAIYQGLVTTIVSLVYLNAGILQEGTRLNIVIDGRIIESVFEKFIHRRDNFTHDEGRATENNDKARLYCESQGYGHRRTTL